MNCVKTAGFTEKLLAAGSSPDRIGCVESQISNNNIASKSKLHEIPSFLPKDYGLYEAPVRRGWGDGVGEPFSIQAVPVVIGPMKQGLASNIFGPQTAFEPPRGVAWVTPIRTRHQKVRTRTDRTDFIFSFFRCSTCKSRT